MLSPFEYVTVLISIILGLGITQIVTGLADTIQQWNRVKFYWPHTMWVVIVFFLHIQEWWNIYDLRLYEVWRLPTFLLISLYPINLFVLARILFPIFNPDGITDYKEFYFNNYQKLFIAVILTAVFSAIENFSIAGRGLEGIFLQLIILVVLSIVAFRKLKQEWIHKLIVTAWILVIIISIIINWDTWLIT